MVQVRVVLYARVSPNFLRCCRGTGSTIMSLHLLVKIATLLAVRVAGTHIALHGLGD